MTDRNGEIEIIARVQYPSGEHWYTVSRVLTHPIGPVTLPKPPSAEKSDDDWLRDRITYADSYMRQAIAQALKIEIVSVEPVERPAKQDRKL